MKLSPFPQPLLGSAYISSLATTNSQFEVATYTLSPKENLKINSELIKVGKKVSKKEEEKSESGGKLPEITEGEAFHLTQLYNAYLTKEDKSPEDLEDFEQLEKLAEKYANPNKDPLHDVYIANMAYDPEHVLRYCRSPSSSPLVYNSFAKMEPVQDCSDCKGKRIFEFQLNCNAVDLLEGFSSEGVVGICVYTCEKSCAKEGWVEEQVVLMVDKGSGERMLEKELLSGKKDMKIKEELVVIQEKETKGETEEGKEEDWEDSGEEDANWA